MRYRLKDHVRSLLDSRPMTELSVWIDIWAAKLAALSPARVRGSAGILAAPGDGNIGDHAMIQVVLDHWKSRQIVVFSEVPAVYDYLHERPNVTVVAVPNLLNTRGLPRLRALWAWARTARTLDEFAVIGADMMDGGYGTYGAVRRWSLTLAAAASGVEARVFGFSWNGRPSPSVRAVAARATGNGVLALVRDPVSYQRVLACGLSNAVESRDVVFAHQFGPAEMQPVPPGRYAVVNASGLIAKNFDQTVDYVNIVQHLCRQGMRVILLPHVLHWTSDDRAALQLIAQSLGNDADVRLVTEQLEPSGVAQIAARAELVVTGRMHLSVLALASGTPAVVLSTQGKVEGLMQAFGFPEGCIEPGPGFSTQVIQLIDELCKRGPELRPMLTEAARDARKLAGLNFSSAHGYAGT